VLLDLEEHEHVELIKILLALMEVIMQLMIPLVFLHFPHRFINGDLGIGKLVPDLGVKSRNQQFFGLLTLTRFGVIDVFLQVGEQESGEGLFELFRLGEG
jgi:hypothetical protein